MVPAVLNYQTEFKFIRLHVAEMPQAQTFYIGGSTFGTGPQGAIEHYEYLPTSIGKRNIVLYVQKTGSNTTKLHNA